MGLCGVLAHEQELPQPLELDIDVVTDLSDASRTDALADTVDYAALLSTAERTVASGSFALLEHLAGRVAEALLDHERVEEVTVCVRKLRPPVPQQLDTCGVRITRGG